MRGRRDTKSGGEGDHKGKQCTATNVAGKGSGYLLSPRSTTMAGGDLEEYTSYDFFLVFLTRVV